MTEKLLSCPSRGGPEGGSGRVLAKKNKHFGPRGPTTMQVPVRPQPDRKLDYAASAAPQSAAGWPVRTCSFRGRTLLTNQTLDKHIPASNTRFVSQSLPKPGFRRCTPPRFSSPISNQTSVRGSSAAILLEALRALSRVAADPPRTVAALTSYLHAPAVAHCLLIKASCRLWTLGAGLHIEVR